MLSRKPPPIKPRTFKVEQTDYNHQENRYYDMTNKKRGIALILNHYKFKSMKERNGTLIDEARLKKTLKSLDFEVSFSTNLYFTYFTNFYADYLQKRFKIRRRQERTRKNITNGPFQKRLFRNNHHVTRRKQHPMGQGQEIPR